MTLYVIVFLALLVGSAFFQLARFSFGYALVKTMAILRLLVGLPPVPAPRRTRG